MKKTRLLLATALLTGSLLTTPASAASLSHTVAAGDTMWKLAVRYQVGTSEIIGANPQVSDPDLIYPGQVLQIPQLDSTVASYEAEVIRLVNQIRQENGLRPLTANWELSRVARYKSQDMLDSGYFAHNSPVIGSYSGGCRRQQKLCIALFCPVCSHLIGTVSWLAFRMIRALLFLVHNNQPYIF